MFHPPFNFGLILAIFITGYTMLLRKRHLQDIGNINAKQKKKWRERWNDREEHYGGNNYKDV